MIEEADYNALPADFEAKMKAKRARARAARSAEASARRFERFASFELEEEIAEGPTARVYRARAADASGTALAVKIIRRAVVAGVETPGARAASLCARRERLVALDHPHLLRVHDVVEDGGRTALILDLREEETLNDHVRERGPLGFQRVAQLGADLSSALQAIHESGLVHNDVEPRNLWLSETRTVLAELSSACEFGTERGDRAIALSGSPQFMAPELLRGEAPTPASDVYALGALLCFALTGRPPLKGPRLHQLRDAHERDARPRLSDKLDDLPRELAELIDRALDGDPAARPSDLAAYGDALRDCAAIDPASARLEHASGFQRWWRTLPRPARILILGGLVVGFVLLLWNRGS
jgi:serine/threonine-protein kinase